MTSPLQLVGIEKAASVEYLDAVFDCYQSGRVAVPIAVGGQPPAGHTFAEVVSVAAGGGWFSRTLNPIESDAPAQISFSSGTTGTPKAILISHRALADVTRRLISASGVDSSLSEYCAVPPTFSFGLGRARVAASVGGRLYLPERGFDPREFAEMLGSGRVNSLAAVPTLLRVLISNPAFIPPEAGARLKWMEIGSQPMSAAEKRTIREMFPNARIIQHYGLTEASRSTFLDIGRASNAELHSVGRAVGDTRVQIDDDGHICIRGPHVADGILNAEGLLPIADSAGWLKTNDLGRIDDNGFLYFLGRADDLINIGGVKVPAEVFEERLVAAIGGAAVEVAVAPVDDAMRGQIIGVGHAPNVPGGDVVQGITAILPEFGLRSADVVAIEVPAIPRTETGKVRRKELASLLSLTSRETVVVSGQTAESSAAMSPAEQEIARIWGGALGLNTVRRDDTFFDLGGDSLSAINVMLSMERAGVPPEITRQIFEGRSVAEIASNMSGPADGATNPLPASAKVMASDAISMTRALLVAVVIGGHWLPFIFVRAGSLSEFLFDLTNPLFRFGTPGFAIVYGLGLTFYNMAVFRRHPDRLRQTVRNNVLILSGGIALLALFRFGDAYLEGAAISPSMLLFSVLFGYLLLVASSACVLRLISGSSHPILASLLMGVSSLIISALLRQQWGNAQTEGFVDLARLMLVAKYSYPQMLGYAGIGMAMGLWIDGRRDSPHLATQALLAGLALIEVAVLLTLTLGLGDSWLGGNAETHMIIGYAGLVLVAFSLCLAAIRRGVFSGALQVPGRVIVLIGTLAFVAFVGHELIIPLHHIITYSGVPEMMSLLISTLIFFCGFGYCLRSLYKIYYGR